MASEPPVVGVVLHPTKAVASSLDPLLEAVRAGAVTAIATGDRDPRLPPDVPLVGRREFRDRVDRVVAFGGDGTILGAMRLVAARPVPVLGVNHGRLGFLAEVERDEWAAALPRFLDGDFTVEPHHALEVDLAGRRRLAFNDVVVVRRPGAGIATIDVAIDGAEFGYYRCDALVLSTAAGSTAYNYAAGGPLLSPAIAAMVLTPVAPMSGVARSVVLGHEEWIVLAVDGGAPALEVDGLVDTDLEPGARIEVRMRRNAGQVVRFDPARSAKRGRLKLSLLDLPLRPDQLREFLPAGLRP